MREPRALVRNAADPQQVGRAIRKERDAADQFVNSLRATMASPDARLVFRTLLERLGVYRSIWENSAKIHYNAGRQDAGHELQALLLQADEGLYDLMEREARARVTRLNRETDAAFMNLAADEGADRG